MPASLEMIQAAGAKLSTRLGLTWLDVSATFEAVDAPFFIGRANDCKFVVSDQRVSRQHAKIEMTSDVFVITDVSSYGTWVRFAGSDTAVALRRQECVLHDKGEIALGASFDDFTVPTVSFTINDPARR